MRFLEKPLSQIPLVFFDLETTGLSWKRGDRICEIALLRQNPDGSEELYESFINPNRAISPSAFRVNRISQSQLKGAPEFTMVASRVQRMLQGALGIAHNARFDLGFLQSEFNRIDQTFLSPTCLDTLLLARAFYSFPKNNLGAVAKNFKISVGQLHRARADVEAMRAVFDIMRKDLVAKGIDTPKQIKKALRSNFRRR